MSEHNNKRSKNLRLLDEKPSNATIGCAMVLVFVFCVGVGATLKSMSISAGQNWLFHVAIWGPLVVLGYYIWRAVNAYQRLPRQTDLDFVDRLTEKISSGTMLKAEPPVPKREPAARADTDEEEGTASTSPESPPSSPGSPPE